MKIATKTKALISWEAFDNDFVIEKKGEKTRRFEKVNEQGPSFNVHRYFGDDYNKHVILCSHNDQDKVRYFDLLVKELKLNFSKTEIVPRVIEIDDVIDIEEIFNKISKLLMEYRNEEIDVFVNPGTPQMQIAWHLLAPNFKKNVRLFQIREAGFTKDKKPERIYTSIDRLLNATTLSVANETVSRKSVDNSVYLSSSIEPVYGRAYQVARAGNISCLILGENGTGKENLAKYIHDNSYNTNPNYMPVNCATYSDELLQSELFGYEKGSFTQILSKGVYLKVLMGAQCF